MKNDILTFTKYGVTFRREKSGYYVPIRYNVYQDDKGKWHGIEVKRGDIIFDYIMFVKYSAGTTDKKTGKKLMNGYLDIYQWIMSIYSITMALKFKSEDLMVAISRQAKL